MSTRGPNRSNKTIVLVLVLLSSGIYGAANLMRGWVPHDEGAMAQSAERVLAGQIPHRDFVDTYTGGLSYLDAWSFRLLGINLASLRYMLYVFFLFWVVSVYLIAAEIAGPWEAGAISLCAVAWSVPNYSAAMPSWYNLFFATFGVLALLRYVKCANRWWLFAAGLCGGCSFLIKSVALYYVCAVLLFLLFREQSLSRSEDPAAGKRTPVYSTFLTLAVFVFVLGVKALVDVPGELPEIVNFVLPAGSLVILVLYRERTNFSRSDVPRFVCLWEMVVPFLAGVALPIALLVLFYAHAGAVMQLFNGVFVLPFRRVLGASIAPPDVAVLLYTLRAALLLGLATYFGGKSRALVTVLALAFGTYVLWGARDSADLYQLAWYALKGMIPFLTVAGAARLAFVARHTSALSLEAQQRMMILLCSAALCTLIQFPFSAAIYFCYVAPLAILALAAVMYSLPSPPRLMLAGAAVFYILFAALLFRPSFLHDMDYRYAADAQTVRMALPRAGGLRISSKSATQYGDLIAVVKQHAGGGGILAAPDCPEVYFLSDTPNLTPALFDFFENRETYPEEIRKLLDGRAINVVVINQKPSFSWAYVWPIQEIAEPRFPHSQMVGSFKVLWRP